MKLSQVLCAVVTSLVLSGAASAGVLTVAQAGTGDFLELQPAVDAASEGDTIWVRSGIYLPVSIQGKSLHLVVMEESSVTVERVSIEGLNSEQVVTVVGLDVRNFGSVPASEATVTLLNCEGSVRWAESVVIGNQALAVSVVDCMDVSFVESSLSVWGAPFVAGSLLAERSQVAFHATTVFGPDNSTTDFGSFYAGGGLLLRDTSLWLYGSTIFGGVGAPYESFQVPTTGGMGIEAEGRSRIVSVNSDIQGGYGGECYSFGPCGGDPAIHQGVAFTLSPGSSHEKHRVKPRSWSAPRVSSDGGSLHLEWSVQPGDELYVVRAARGVFDLASAVKGVQLVNHPSLAAPFVGVAPSQGVVSFSLPLRDLRVGVNEGTILLQSFVRTSQGEEFWLEPQALSLLDGARLETFTGVVHVDVDAAAGGDGQTWATARDDLGAVLRELRDSYYGDIRLPRQVWVAEGTYRAPVGSGLQSGFMMDYDCRLLGGFAGGEVSASERDPELHVTVLDGDQLGDDGPGFTNRDDNAPRLLRAGASGPRATSIVDGFTLRGARGGSTVPVYLQSSYQLRQCQCVDNQAGSYFLQTAPSKGPLQSSLTYCRFEGNEVTGPAVVYADVGVRIDSCSFVENLVTPTWGATVRTRGVSQIINSLFLRNEAGAAGALLIDQTFGEEILVAQCTLLENRGTSGPGGILVMQGPFDLRGSILWGNSNNGVVDEDAQIEVASPGSTTVLVRSSDLEGWSGALGGPGNIGLDPMLDALGLPAAGSPCVDVIRPAALPMDAADLDLDGDLEEALPLDARGRPRVADDPGTVDSGPGPAPHVDMGAIERAPGD